MKDIKRMRHFIFLIALLGSLLSAAAARAAISIPEDKYSAVVLAYHRIGEDAYPDSDLRTEQFTAHIEEIVNGDYNVMPLGAIIDAIKNHQELPPRTLAITFEGAFKSALDKAIPLLLEKKIPFTVFYSSGELDSNAGEYMSWSDLKSLNAREGVTLGTLPASYSKLATEPEAEIRRQINKALIRHREIFKTEPLFFSYPFGEYSIAYEKIISEAGFKAAFGLHSGTIYEGSDFFALPRFTMTEKFGDVERFRLVVNALPLPATDIEPKDPHITTGAPNIGFSLPPALAKEITGLSCFISGQPQPETEIIGNRVELRMKDIPGDERLRLNCTMPGPVDQDNDVEQWRWLGMLLIGQNIPPPDETLNNPPPDVPQ